MYRDFLRQNGVLQYASLPFSECRVTKPYLVEKIKGFVPQSVLMLLIPYYAGEAENLSVYAASRDYHLFMKDLLSGLSNALASEFRGYSFYGFSDHSPIDEREAASKAGLGVIGENGLLITERYSSFVFIAEIVSDIFPEALGTVSVFEVRHCFGCGACKKACPTGILRGEGDACLSALTQKKGALTEAEADIIKKCGSAWGCDVCQNVCPYTEKAKRSGSIMTEIPFFYEKRIERLTLDGVCGMTDEEFDERAFSWRGRATLLRNLEILK